LNLRRFRFLADENIHTDVVSFLRDLGYDVLDVREQGWSGPDDLSLIHEALQDSRVVLTHDSDFGALAVGAGEPIVGIIYLRPGHIRPLTNARCWRSCRLCCGYMSPKSAGWPTQDFRTRHWGRPGHDPDVGAQIPIGTAVSKDELNRHGHPPLALGVA